MRKLRDTLQGPLDIRKRLGPPRRFGIVELLLLNHFAAFENIASRDFAR